MNRIAGSYTDVQFRYARRQYVPLLSTIVACLLALLPIVVSTPIIPDFALLVLVAWRLLRTEMWTVTTVLPLGLFNDLIAGHPLGQSIALWTAIFLVFDVMEARLVWRDYWIDWLAASLVVVFYTFATWYIGWLMGNRIEFTVMLPQMALSIFIFPVIARIVLILDRWRLSQ